MGFNHMGKDRLGVAFSLAASDVFAALMGFDPPVLVDARRADIISASGHLIPGGLIADQGDGPQLAAQHDKVRKIVVAFTHGHNRSQRLAAYLRAEDFQASILANGYGPLQQLALIARGADTDRIDLAPQSAGLLAMSLGLSARHGDDDHGLLAAGFRIYDGLLAWAVRAIGERPGWPRPAVGAVS